MSWLWQTGQINYCKRYNVSRSNLNNKPKYFRLQLNRRETLRRTFTEVQTFTTAYTNGRNGQIDKTKFLFIGHLRKNMCFFKQSFKHFKPLYRNPPGILFDSFELFRNLQNFFIFRHQSLLELLQSPFDRIINHRQTDV